MDGNDLSDEGRLKNDSRHSEEERGGKGRGRTKRKCQCL